MKHAAIEKLRPIMGIFEMLPLSSKDGDYSVVNILTVLDCVDYVNSRYVSLKARATDRYPRILRFEKCSLLPEAIHGHHIFRIINHPKSRLYVDEVFVNEVVKQGITGFAFEQIWASEAE